MQQVNQTHAVHRVTGATAALSQKEQARTSLNDAFRCRTSLGFNSHNRQSYHTNSRAQGSAAKSTMRTYPSNVIAYRGNYDTMQSYFKHFNDSNRQSFFGDSSMNFTAAVKRGFTIRRNKPFLNCYEDENNSSSGNGSSLGYDDVTTKPSHARSTHRNRRNFDFMSEKTSNETKAIRYIKK